MKQLFLAVCILLSLSGASSSYASNKHIQKQIECLADNIYHESKGESYLGKTAVGFVTLNRTQSEDFPSDVCEVVKQKDKKRCQFSWYCQESKKRQSKMPQSVKLENIDYLKCKIVAEYVYRLYDVLNDPTKGSLYFHANYVKVKASGKVVRARIGKHIFYDIRRKI